MWSKSIEWNSLAKELQLGIQNTLLKFLYLLETDFLGKNPEKKSIYVIQMHSLII
jgi:hypothetical protein